MSFYSHSGNVKKEAIPETLHGKGFQSLSLFGMFCENNEHHQSCNKIKKTFMATLIKKQTFAQVTFRLTSTLFTLIVLFCAIAHAQGYNTGNIYINGNVYLNGSFTNENTANYLNNGTYSLAGDFINNQASMSAGTATSSGTIAFAGVSLQTVGGTQPSNFYNATINNASHVKMGADLYISNIFTPKNGNLLINGNNLNLGGVIDNSGSNTGAIAADADANGTSSLSITGAGNLTGSLKFATGSQVLKNFSLNRTASGIATLASDLSVGGTTSITNNGVANFKSGSLVINGNTLSLNGTVTGTGTLTGSTTSNLSIGGNLSTQLGTIYFTNNGAGQQLNTISINRAIGTTIGNAVLGTALTVNNITLTKGVIATGDNLFTWNKTGALTAPNIPYAAHTANYNNSFIATCNANGAPITASIPFDGSKGFRINNVSNNDTYFPVGSSFLGAGPGLSAAPNRMMLNNHGTTDNFTVVVNNGDAGNTPAKIVERIWYVKATSNATIKADMNLYFTKRDPAAYATGGQNEVETGFNYSDSRLLQESYQQAYLNISNVASDIHNFSAYTNNQDEIYAEYDLGESTDWMGAANGINYFNKFTVINQANIILPVTILDVNASLKNDKVSVNWAAGNEVNIDRYEVEHSSDAVNFTVIGKAKALNNGQLRTDYQLTDDQPAQGNNYYRIRAIDKTDKNTYSKIVKVVTGDAKNNITVYPNPITGSTTNLQFQNIPSGNYSLQLFNAAGKMIWQKNIDHQSTVTTYQVQLGSGLSKGIYHLLIQGNNNKFDKKLFK